MHILYIEPDKQIMVRIQVFKYNTLTGHALMAHITLSPSDQMQVRADLIKHCIVFLLMLFANASTKT